MVHSPVYTWVAVLLLGVALLAGCVGSDETVETQDQEQAPPEKTDENFDQESGAVWGAVSSDVFMPIEGAQAQFLTSARTETDHKAVTGEDGEFIVPFVEPGTYIVYVTAVGFEAEQRQVEVTAGAMSEVRIVMTPLPSDGPWAEEFDRSGFMGSSVAWRVEPPVAGCVIVEDPTEVRSCSEVRIGARAGETRVGPFSIPPGWTGAGSQNFHETDLSDVKTIMVEMAWQSAGPLGESFLLDLMCSDVPRGESGWLLDLEHECYFDQRGESPLIHRVDEEHWLEHGYNFTGTWAARVYAAYGMLGTYDLTGVDFGLAYQQSFEKYWTIFHEEPAPEDYTRLPDA